MKRSKIMHPLHASAIAGLLAMLISPAHAGLILDYETAAPPIPTPQVVEVKELPLAQVRRTLVVHRGDMPTEIAKNKAVVKGEPLLTALRKVIPGDWKVFSRDPRVKDVKNVTYAGGGRDWVKVFEEVLEAKDLAAYVDWDHKEVTLTMVTPR